MTTTDDPSSDPSGFEKPPASFRFSRALFIRLMGVVYACAFASMLVQVRGLFGSRGILPAARYLDMAREQLGTAAYWRVPTVLWWSHSDGSLVALCAAGVALAGALVVGLA